MAGIGFELKKLFSKKGLFAILRAYGYAGIVCSGPMILGIVLILGIHILSIIGGASENTQNLLNAMITYTLFYSLFVSNLFSMITTRYTADSMYMGKNAHVLPSFYGSISIMLLFGSITYAIFLCNAGIPPIYQILCLMLFGELIIVWTEITYLSAVKDYKGILWTFFVALLVALFIGYLLMINKMPVVVSLLSVICIGYGIMMVWYYYLLVQYFPQGKVSAFYFLKWFDKYPSLTFLGFFMSAGLFSHLILMWFSPIGIKIQGLFYGAPSYDVPALFAFLSTLITTINFVTSVEVNFYPKYKNYFSLFNFGGSLTDIKQAEVEMKVTLQNEMEYTFTKQFFVTLIFIIVGSIFLPLLPLGFTDQTLGIYRVLCVGYAFYAIGNSLMLITLYFSDNRGASIAGGLFALISCIGTLILRNESNNYYGFGFVAGGVAFTVFSLIHLWKYLKNLMYHVLSTQPIVVEERRTVITKWSDNFEKRYEYKQMKRNRRNQDEE